MVGTLETRTVLRDWAARAVGSLDECRAQLDALNVFPVADSDTGTNLFLTLREALEAVGRIPDGATDGEVGGALTRGALVGARGNSGVIVSQYLGALVRALLGPGPVDTRLVRGLHDAADAAYRAVAHPVEGTVLTVARAVAEGAAEASAAPLETGLDAGYEALARTTTQLAALRAAGVRDAGAWGLLLVLDALADALDPGRHVERESPAGGTPCDEGTPCEHCDGEELGTGEFEVMYIVDGEAPTDDGVAAALRDALSAIGDSAAIVGGDGLLQAHVHTDVPLAALDAAHAAGFAPVQIRVRHLASQSGVHGAHRPPLGLVAVTGAPGLAADLARAGAVVVLVPHGRTAGPELHRAIDDTGAPSVLVLGAVDVLTDVDTRPDVDVVTGLSEVQLVAAAATFASLDPTLGERGLAEAVVDAARAVRTAEVDVGGEGEAASVVAAARALVDEGASLLTVLVPVGAPAGIGADVAAALEGRPAEVVALASGCPGARVVLGAE